MDIIAIEYRFTFVGTNREENDSGGVRSFCYGLMGRSFTVRIWIMEVHFQLEGRPPCRPFGEVGSVPSGIVSDDTEVVPPMSFRFQQIKPAARISSSE